MLFAEESHDLSLPAWGPYTKRYAGISHIADPARGIRFDLSVFPGYYRGRVDVPNVAWESGFHPWEAAPDLTYYSFRHELAWKDRLYADISYSRLDEHTTLIRCAIVNETDATEHCTLHFMGSLHYPALRAHSDEPLVTYEVQGEGFVALHALDYASMRYAHPRPTDNLMPDGLWRGELRGDGYVQGSALGAPRNPEHTSTRKAPYPAFGTEEGDTVTYDFEVRQPMKDAVLQLRYRQEQEGASFLLQGDFTGRVKLTPGEGMRFARVSLGDLDAGVYTVSLVSTGQGCAALDSLLIGPAECVDEARYVRQNAQKTPRLLAGPVPNSLLLDYEAVPQVYGLYWDFDDYVVREILHGELDSFLRLNAHQHVSRVLQGDSKGHFANVFQRPIVVPPHGERVLYGCVSDAATAEEACERIMALVEERNSFEELYREARKRRAVFQTTPAGEPFLFSQERMAATQLYQHGIPRFTAGARLSATLRPAAGGTACIPGTAVSSASDSTPWTGGERWTA